LRSVISYPGYLIPEKLYEQLVHEYRIPTGVHVANLDYTPLGSQVKVEVILVGLPTAAGPIMNDAGRFPETADKVVCSFQSQPFANLGMSKIAENSGQELPKVAVPDDFVSIIVRKGAFTNATIGLSEVIGHYETKKGQGEFWKDPAEEIYCDSCQRTEDTEENPIIVCGYRDEKKKREVAAQCSAGRHRDCWGSEIPLALGQITELKHYCQFHLPKSHIRDKPRRTHLASPSGSPIVTNNLPPAPEIGQRTSRARSQAILPNDEEGLQHNNSRLGLETKASSLPGAGLGCFVGSSKSFAKNQCIGWFFGAIITKDRYDGLIDGSLAAESPAETFFMKEYKDGVCRSLDISQALSDSNDEYVMLVSKQCPVGYINDPRGTKKSKSFQSNCSIEWPKDITITTSTMDFQAIPIHATGRIDAGQELFWSYGYDPRKKPRGPKVSTPATGIAHRGPMADLADSLPLFCTPPEEPVAIWRRFLALSPDEAIAAMGPRRNIGQRLAASTKPTVKPADPLAEVASCHSTLGIAAGPVPPDTTGHTVGVTVPAAAIVHLEAPPCTNVAVDVEPTLNSLAHPEIFCMPGADISRRSSAEAPHSDGLEPVDITRCKECCRDRPASDFSAAQRAKAGLSVCKVCVAKLVTTAFHREQQGNDSSDAEEDPLSDDEVVDQYVLNEPISTEHMTGIQMMECLDSCNDGPDHRTALVAQICDDESEEDEDDDEDDEVQDEIHCESFHSESASHASDQDEWREYELASPARGRAMKNEVVHNRRVSAAPARQPPDHPAVDFSSLPCIIRSPARVKKLPDYAVFEPSLTQLAMITARAEAFIQAEKLKNVTVDDILQKPRGECYLRRLPADWAEVQACCANTDRRDSFTATHPFKSLENFIDHRFKLAAGRASEDSVSQTVLDYLINRSPDPADDGRKPAEKTNRVMFLGGVRICESCFRALTGRHRSTIFRLKAFLDSGQVKVLDMRTQRQAVNQPVSDQLIAALKLLADNLADPVPNPADRNEEYVFLELPFTQRSQLCDYLSEQLTVDVNSPVVVSSNSVHRAIMRFKKDFGVFLSLAKVKRFMKCTACKKFDNRKKFAKSAEERMSISLARQAHFSQVQEQRQHYSDIRDIAK
jgi:hypothetical protein